MRDLPSLAHLRALSDDVGIIQHATFDVPNRATGYCIDDVARALIVACDAAAHATLHDEAMRLARIYLAFVHDAQQADGRFHNFMGYDRRWLDHAGGDDSFGRAIWALGKTARSAPVATWRSFSLAAIDRSLDAVGELGHLRSLASAALGLVLVDEALAGTNERVRAALRDIGARLLAAAARGSDGDWVWFESRLTYDNGRLCEAALRIGAALGDAELVDCGLRTLAFYESVAFEDGLFVPIGAPGWFARGGERARYAQQPIEAAATIAAELAAEACAGGGAHRALAEAAYAWFWGANTRRAIMVADGAAYDGLEADGINRNCGAEATVSYLASALALSRHAEAEASAVAK